jgi:hypothetical protein
MPETQEWITKKQASAIWGLSDSATHRLAVKRKLKKRWKAPGAGSNSGCMLYLKADVDRIYAERAKPPEDNPSRIIDATPDPALEAQIDEFIEQTNGTAAAPRISERPQMLGAQEFADTRFRKEYLTLTEAEIHSGLTRNRLVQLVKTDQIDCEGGRIQDTWRIRRASLEAWGAGGNVADKQREATA